MEGMNGCRPETASTFRFFRLNEIDVRLLVRAINDGGSLTVAEWDYMERLVGRLEGFVEEADREEMKAGRIL